MVKKIDNRAGRSETREKIDFGKQKRNLRMRNVMRTMVQRLAVRKTRGSIQQR